MVAEGSSGRPMRHAIEPGANGASGARGTSGSTRAGSFRNQEEIIMSRFFHTLESRTLFTGVPVSDLPDPANAIAPHDLSTAIGMPASPALDGTSSGGGGTKLSAAIAPRPSAVRPAPPSPAF
jgi:hypothetical protein